MKERIQTIIDESIRVKKKFLQENLEILEKIIRALAEVIKQGNKILFFGNGGSAADAQHFAAEYVNRYIIDRVPLPALALTTDTSVLTAISNDFEYEDVFAKQIKALGKAGDAAVGISTSGKSKNVVNGLTTAHEQGLVTIGIGGPPHAPMSRACTYYLSVADAATPRIQETHVLTGHIMVEILDELLFGDLAGH